MEGERFFLASGGEERRATDRKSDRGEKKRGTQSDSLIIFTPNAERTPFFGGGNVLTRAMRRTREHECSSSTGLSERDIREMGGRRDGV